MKRFFVFMASLVLLLSSCAASGPDPEGPASSTLEADPSLTALREEILQSESFCAIAYLGRLPEDGDLERYLEETGALAAYPFLAELIPEQVVRHQGPEIYCIVPRTQEAALTVQAWICNEENHYRGEAGERLYEADNGVPVLLLGNDNEVIPNLFLTLEEPEAGRLEYNPCLSLCDGTVDLPAAFSLYDFSRYESVR